MASNPDSYNSDNQFQQDDVDYEQDYQVEEDYEQDFEDNNVSAQDQNVNKQQQQSKQIDQEDDDYAEDYQEDDFEEPTGNDKQENSQSQKEKQSIIINQSHQEQSKQSIKESSQQTRNKHQNNISRDSKKTDSQYYQDSFQNEDENEQNDQQEEDYNEDKDVIDNKISQALLNHSLHSSQKSLNKQIPSTQNLWDDEQSSNKYSNSIQQNKDRSRVLKGVGQVQEMLNNQNSSMNSGIPQGEIKSSIYMFKTDDSLVNVEEKQNNIEQQNPQALQLDQSRISGKSQNSKNNQNMKKEQENIKPPMSTNIRAQNYVPRNGSRQRTAQKDQKVNNNDIQEVIAMNNNSNKIEPSFRVSKPQTALKTKRQSVQRQIFQSNQKNQNLDDINAQKLIKSGQQSTNPIQPKKFLSQNEINKSQSRPQTSKVQTQNDKIQQTLGVQQSHNMNKGNFNRNSSQSRTTYSSMIQSNPNKFKQKVNNLNNTQVDTLPKPQSRGIATSQGGVRERLKQIIQSNQRNSSISQKRMNSQTRSTSQLNQINTKRSVVMKPKLELNSSARYADKETRFGSSKRFSSDSFLHGSNIKSNMSATKSRISLGRLQGVNSQNARQSTKNIVNNSMVFTNRLQSANGMKSTRSNAGKQSQVLLQQSVNNLHQNIRQIKIADYYDTDPRKSLVIKQEDKIQGKVGPLDRMLRMSQGSEFPIQILDSIINVEEQIYGFSLYNRGENLKKSLIDPERVKAYIDQHKNISPEKLQNTQLSLKNDAKTEKDDWQTTLAFLKQNPSVLLDAIPTPRNDETELVGFDTGLTPKKSFDFKFNQGISQSVMSLQNRKNSNRDPMILQQSTPTQKNQFISPKPNLLLSNKKLNLSSSKAALMNATNTSGFGNALGQSTSRQSLLRSPSVNKDQQQFNRSFSRENLQKIYGGNSLVNELKIQSPLRKNQFEKKDFRITKALRNIQSAKSQQRNSNIQNQNHNGFRNPNLQDSNENSFYQASSQQTAENKNILERKRKRQLMMLEQEKALNDRKVQANRLKQKLRHDYQDPQQVVKRDSSQEQLSSNRFQTNTGKSSIQPNNQIDPHLANRIVLSTLDWKTSKIYTDYVVAKKNNKLIFEQNDQKVFREDEIDYVKNMIHLKAAEGGAYSDDMNRLCNPFITKAYNTLDIILKELLQNDFMQEYDRIYMDREFGGSLFEKLNYLIERMKGLFKFREDILEFFYRVHERELVLSEMKKTVMNIQNEKEIEEELFINPTRQSNGGSMKHQMEIKQQPTREKIQRLGDSLVELTDEVLKQVKKFINAFNKVMDFVRIEHFVFEEADYEMISFKEVKEIKDIFRAFDIKIRDLTQKRVY